MSSGTFSGSLSVTGTNASLFQISGGNLVLSGATTTGGTTYNINIVATQTGVATFTQNFPNIQATAASQESAEGFTVTTVGPIMFASTSAGFAQSTGPWNQFALVSTGTNDFHISLNGSTSGSQAGTGFVTELIYHNHTAYQANSLGGWWRWDTTSVAWVEYGVSVVSLSNSSYASNAPANTLIGTVSIAMLDGTAFNGTLLVSDTAHFKMVGSQLQAATTLSATSYPITITAVPAITTDSTHVRIGEVGTLNVTVAVTGTLVAPSQAANAGFTRLAMNSDFTSTTDVTGDTTAASGFFWYPGLDFDTTYTVNRTATAASISNGNVGGGNNASPAGGILTLLTQNVGSGYSGMFVTLPFNPLNFNGAVLPAVGQGHWSHAYFETYMQFVSNGNTGLAVPNGPATGGPAFWSWAAQDLFGYGAGGSSLNASPNAEVDFMEHFGTMFHGSNTWETTLREWQGSNLLASTSVATGTTDSNWHTYGMLWKSTGAGAGSLTMYVDNVQQGGSLATFTEMESQTLFIVLGTGNQNWHTNFDWVRVWTA